MCLSTLLGWHPPLAPPIQPRDAQGTEPQAVGTSPVCPQARLGWTTPAQGKASPQQKPPCSHRPSGCSEAWEHSPAETSGRRQCWGVVLGPHQEPSQPRLASPPRSHRWLLPVDPWLLQDVPTHTHCGGTARLCSTDRSSNSTYLFFFIKAKPFWKFWGLPPTSYKFYQAQIPSPRGTHSGKSCKRQAGRERGAPALEMTGIHGNAPVYVSSSCKAQHPAPWLQTPRSRAWRSTASRSVRPPASSPAPCVPLQAMGLARKAQGRAGREHRGSLARHHAVEHPGKIGMKETRGKRGRYRKGPAQSRGSAMHGFR